MSPLRRICAPSGALVPVIRSPALLLLAALLVAAPAFAQETETDWDPLDSFDEAISVEVTNIEVWVTDRDGRPVTGLTPDDFVLTEDGDRVEISNFSAAEAEAQGSWSEAVSGAGRVGDADGAEEAGGTPVASAETGGSIADAEPPVDTGPYTLPEPAPRPESEIDPETRLHLVILIDNWNLQPADRARVFQDLRTFLRERLRPEDRAMVLVHDRALGLVQEMTNDPDLLLAALSRVERAATANIQIANERRTSLQNIRDAYENAVVTGPEELPDPCQIAWGDIQANAQNYGTTVMAHTQRSAGALASAGDLLAGVPGRKILLYVGSGLPQQPGSELFHYLTELCPHKQSEIATWSSSFDLTWLYEEVARRANANGLTLYTIEASAPSAVEDISIGNLAGPTSPSDGGRQGAGFVIPVQSGGQTFRPSVAAIRSAELDQEAGLFYVANETGGRAILNAADFARDFERLATELRTYYSLGFKPDHSGDGRLHTIDVKLKKGLGDGWRVRHRQSYHDKPYEQRMAEKIRGVAQFGTEANRLHVRVETGEATPTGGGYRVPIRVWVPLDEMTLVSPKAKTQGGHRAGRLRVMMAVSDAAGNLGPVRQKLVDVEVGDGEAVGDGREHLVEVDLDLPTASHVVALGLRDELGGETSFVRYEIDLAGGEIADGGR